MELLDYLTALSEHHREAQHVFWVYANCHWCKFSSREHFKKTLL